MPAFLGLMFWALVIGLPLYYWLRPAQVSIQMDAHLENGDLSVQGMVLYDGKPIRSGSLRVVAAEMKSGIYVFSQVIPVQSAGSFQTRHAARSATEPLRVTATFQGSYARGDKEAGYAEGEVIEYINTPPPGSLRTMFAWLASIFSILALPLVFFITTKLSERSGRWLFRWIYLLTFSSLALPIMLSILASRNASLLEVLEGAPIGIVRARTEPLGKAQWLLNIGGILQKEGTAEGTPPAQAREASGQAGKAPEASSPAAEPPAADQSASPPEKPSPRDAEAGVRSIAGGIAVPFYVVMLAMLGAGINMTLKVPAIQERYNVDVLGKEALNFAGTLRRAIALPVGGLSRVGGLGGSKPAKGAEITPEPESQPANPPAEVQAETATTEARAATTEAKAASADTEAPVSEGKAVKAPAKVAATEAEATTTKGGEAKTAAGIVKELVENCMYLLSAPFLAIAMYYLLQVVGEQIKEPVLVIMAFATGLSSDSIVKGIISFAESKFAPTKNGHGKS